MKEAKLIVICGSMIFLDKLNNIRDNLKLIGHKVVSPKLSKEEVKSGAKTFEDLVSEKGGIKKVLVNDKIWNIKTKAIRDYFKYIEKADAILICNFTKGKEEDRIGDNAYLEMCIAFYLKKKIFVLNGPPYNSSKCEEVIAMKPTFLFGDLSKIGRAHV